MMKQLQSNAEQILDKLQTVNSEYLKWFEILLAMVFAIIGYAAPILMLKFQVIIRKMSMEDEVMQYPNNHTNAYETRKS